LPVLSGFTRSSDMVVLIARVGDAGKPGRPKVAERHGSDRADRTGRYRVLDVADAELSVDPR
jgi:hypothetical protein